MNMPGAMTSGVSAMDVIVFAVVASAVLFTLAWSVSPELRAWIERPKYRFLRNVRSYDESK